MIRSATPAANPVARAWRLFLSGGLAVLLLAALLAGTGPSALAASPAPAAAVPAPAAGGAVPAAGAAPVVVDEATVQQLEALVGTLENQDARTQLVTQLRNLITAQRGLAEAKESEGESALPQTIGAHALAFLAARMDVVSRQIVQVGNVFADLPGALSWVQRQVEDDTARDRWVQIGIQLAMILGVGRTGRRRGGVAAEAAAPSAGRPPCRFGPAAHPDAAGPCGAGAGADRRLHRRRLHRPVGDRTGAARAAGGAGGGERHRHHPGPADRGAHAVRAGSGQPAAGPDQRCRGATLLCLVAAPDRGRGLRLFPGRRRPMCWACRWAPTARC